jgi:hypothetical protein
VFDSVAPTITVTSASAVDATTGWYSISSSGSAGIDVYIAASDASGIALLSCTLNGEEQVLGMAGGTIHVTDGTYLVSCYAEDNSGNFTTNSAEFDVDQTAPVISDDGPTTSANPAGWYNTDVTNTFSASDALSGLDADCLADFSDAGNTQSKTTSGEGEDLTVTSDSCTDVAGNTAGGVESAEFDVDQTAPTASASRSPLANTNGWNNTDVTVNFEGSDSLSGIASCSTDEVLGEGANQSASGTCTDNAGNVSEPASITGVNVDKTAPVVSCTAASFTLNEPGATVSANVTDALSGAVDAVVSASVSTAAVGSYSVNLTGEDLAGNETTVACAYTVGYNFIGLAAPVNKPDIMNVSKASQAIPLKWRITDFHGVGVTTLTSVGVIVTDLSCTLGTTTDLMEEYASGASGLQNLGDGYYQFNWKTPKTYAGSCKSLSIKLGSAVDAPKMENLALFTFKK